MSAAAPASAAATTRAAHILPLAWPVFIAQLAVIAFGTLDTLLVARYAALDLAALAVGSAAYITVFIGFMGVVVAAGPIVGQFFGASKLPEAGHQLHQAVWLALGLSVVGCTLLVFPWPFMALSQAAPEVEAKVRQYLLALAFALPAALLFAAYRGFNNAVSRPKAVMVIQLAGLGAEAAAVGGAGVRRAGAGRCPSWACWAAASPPPSPCGRRCWPGCGCCGATASTHPSRWAAAGCGRPTARPWARSCAWACRWARRS